MHLHKLEVTNFRSLKNLEVDLSEGANLLVGPNAAGKTTVLEAIRLAKALLAPRSPQELRQVLISLGAMSATQQMNFRAIAGDLKKPIKINCVYKVTDEEVRELQARTGEIANSLIAAQQGIDLNSANGELNLIQLLSTPFGQQAKTQALHHIQDPLTRLVKDQECRINLMLSADGSFKGENVYSQLMFSVLERRLPPGKAMLSYFPADRAMNTGDAQIQIGSADAQQQLDSHNATPQLKYQRLKNVIFSTLLSGTDSANEQKEVFRSIFSSLLKGKNLVAAEINKFGQATVMIQDEGSTVPFDIDSMSSGEKGLILTFLLIARTVQEGGLVLLDEPELHLNSGVCKNLLEFLMDEYVKKLNLQVILCTHSAEIMSTALRREDCRVFNMRRDGPISLIRRSDHLQAAQVLKLLGTSEIESLLFDAVVFVEGPDDVELLEFAFRDFLSRLKFRELAGRGEVEKYIRLLIEADKDGRAENTKFFIFDRDNKPADLVSTATVKLRQWDRYCLENYLIEPDILHDTITLDLKPKNWPDNLADAKAMFLDIARKQLRGRIIEATYKEMNFQDVRLRSEDKKDSFAEAGASLYGKLDKLRIQVVTDVGQDWTDRFAQSCQDKFEKADESWTADWIEQCNGKQFLLDIYQYARPRVDISTFKRSLLAAHKSAGSQSWKSLRATVEELVSKMK